jgi:uncharacterized circularly permuted ATP-grasp superfamily protein
MALKNTQDLFANYKISPLFFDEVFYPDCEPRPHYRKVAQHFRELSLGELTALNEYTKLSFFNQGITFNVYSDKVNGSERIFPFDLFPRVIPADEWKKIEDGVIQRTRAINMLLLDLYNEQKILKEKVIPRELVSSSKQYIKQMREFKPVEGIYTHISGTDLIRAADGEYYVLEDNVRCPSGVSYVLSNRVALKRTLPDLISDLNVQAVDNYPEKLLEMMISLAPPGVDEPTCVLLTPGMYNSAYFEHTFLASQMGIDLVEGRDLYVENNFVYMKTIKGGQKVDVIYRRVDDDFIDPLIFRKDSLLGVEGLIEAYRHGNVTLLNAPGTGISDDKAMYTFMPEIIKFYLSEEPILKNVHTFRCYREDDCKFVVENMDKLVVKPVDESGGYGVMIGSKTTKKERKEYADKLLQNPRKYIAQPIMPLSTHPTFIEDSHFFEQRHVDLRTYALYSKNEIYVCKGGLSRVALRKGSLIVNSSQGGGSKDTWALAK